tara:strand:+ start:100978 stop:101277 length:300 start_codon:yes stop_codon:yes gene_type:complete
MQNLPDGYFIGQLYQRKVAHFYFISIKNNRIIAVNKPKGRSFNEIYLQVNHGHMVPCAHINIEHCKLLWDQVPDDLPRVKNIVIVAKKEDRKTVTEAFK